MHTIYSVHHPPVKNTIPNVVPMNSVNDVKNNRNNKQNFGNNNNIYENNKSNNGSIMIYYIRVR